MRCLLELILCATVLVAYVLVMASITLKNIPEPLHCAYKRRAKANSRSLQAEILQTLARGVVASDETKPLAVVDVAGILKPKKRKGVTIAQMEEGISLGLRESWK